MISPSEVVVAAIKRMGEGGPRRPIAAVFLAMGATLVQAMAGCATGYHPVSFTGGYSELQVNARTFQVHFEGNGNTSNATTAQGAMHRAAELTIERGFFGFWVSNQGTQVDTSIHTSSNGHARFIEKPDSTLTISMMTRDEAQSAPPGMVVYDARLILSQMGY